MIRLFCYFFVLSSAWPAFAQPADETANRNHFFPLIADGDGLRTLLFIANVSETANRCALGLRGQDLDIDRFGTHANVASMGSRASIDFPAADENLLLESVGEDALAFGYGMMECAGPVVVRILLSLSDADSPLALTNAGSMRVGHDFQLPVLPHSGRQGLLLSNDTTFEAACAIELKDAEGADAGAGDAFVAARSILWKALEDLIPIPEGYDGGTVTLACGRELGLLGMTLNGSVFTALPVIALNGDPYGETSALLPLVADGDGFRSRLLVTNLADTANRCLVELHGAGLDRSRFEIPVGSASAAGAVLELPSGGDQQSLVSTNAAGLAFGYASFECDGPADVRNLLSTSVQGSLAGMASISASQQADEFEFPVAPRAGRLALVFSNDNASEAACMVELQAFDGAGEGARRVPVPAKSTTVRFLADLFGERPAGFSGGLAAVSCDTGVGAVSLPLSKAVFAALPPVVSSGMSRISGSAPTFGSPVFPAFEIYPLDEAIDPLQLPAASGGDAPLRYSLQPDVPGLRFDPATRRLSGTPTVSDIYEMKYRVKDVDGDSDTHEFGIWVREPDTEPSFTDTPEDQDYRLDEAIDPLQLPEAVGGNEPVDYLLIPYVPGLYFDPETRRLDGTPSEPGIYSVTYSAIDANFDTDAVTFVITVTVPVAARSSLEATGCADGTFVDDPDANAGLVADCRALVGFANALIENGLHAEGNPVRQWGRGERQKLDSWQGIGLSDGRVDSVNLEFSSLKGDLPSELAQLDELKELNLWENELTGPIPPELGDLSSLKSLLLGSNRLSGAIPPELGQLDKLTELDIASNELTGPIPPELGNLSRLEFLRMDSNRFSGGIPAELGRLDQLLWLALGDNGLSGAIPPELGQIDQLTSLDLGSNKLSGAIPLELGRLDQLDSLNLAGNKLSGAIPPELSQLDQLTTLDLVGNELSGPIPPELRKLTRLRFLLLSNNQLTGTLPEELAELDDLEALDISFNQLRGTIPWIFRERVLSGDLTLPISGTLIGGFETPPDPARNPAYPEDAVGNGNASFHSTAWFQGPLVLEWNGQGERVEYQTPILGRWAALAVRVDHAVEYPPQVITRVLDAQGQMLAESLAKAGAAVTEKVESGRWRTEYVFHLPGALFQAGNRIVHVIDPDEELAETDEADNLSEPFVIHGEQPPPFRVTFIPVRLLGAEDIRWSEDLDPDLLMPGTLALLPIADDFETRIGSPLPSANKDIDPVLVDLLTLWNLEADPDEFYHGITAAPVGGIALIGGRVAVSSMSVHDVIPHEFGHNFNLLHTSGCLAEGPDENYPYPDGQLGLLPGWDRNWRRFISGETTGHADVMSYCGDSQFISAYNYRLATEYWLSQPTGMNDATPPVLARASARKPPATALGGDSSTSSRQAASPEVASLALSGRVGVDGSWSLIQAQLSASAPRPPADDGEYTLILFDQAGVQLHAEPITLLSLSTGGGLLWVARTPLPLRTAREIAILDAQGNELLRETLPELE